jgi:hypothetical protein
MKKNGLYFVLLLQQGTTFVFLSLWERLRNTLLGWSGWEDEEVPRLLLLPSVGDTKPEALQWLVMIKN